LHLVRYEDLVKEPASVVRQMCAALGESFEEAMLQFSVWAGKRPLPDHHRNLAKPIGASSVARYTSMAAEEVAQIEAWCREEMHLLDYAPSQPPLARTAVMKRPSLPARVLARLRFYGLDRHRWRLGWMNWRIAVRLRWHAWLRKFSADSD
jgi:hypothetical protein